MLWYLNYRTRRGRNRHLSRNNTRRPSAAFGLFLSVGRNQGSRRADGRYGVRGELGVPVRFPTLWKATTIDSRDVSGLRICRSTRHLWIGLAEIPGVTVNGVSDDHPKRIDFQNDTTPERFAQGQREGPRSGENSGSEVGEPLLIEEDLSVSEERSADNRVLWAEGGNNESAHKQLLAIARNIANQLAEALEIDGPPAGG